MQSIANYNSTPSRVLVAAPRPWQEHKRTAPAALWIGDAASAPPGIHFSYPVLYAPSMAKQDAYPAVYYALGIAVFVLLIGGALGMLLAPSPLTAVPVPLGLSLWALLAAALKRFDSPREDGR